jgi:cytoskeletal protein RodZ
MLDNEKLNTQIEAYLRGDMSPSDKAIFEQQMEKDPLIQNELEMQQAIIHGIQHSRKLAMKASLNSMNVSLWSLAVSEAIKVAAGVIIGGVLIGGSYYLANNYLSNEDSFTPTATVEANEPGSVSIETPTPIVSTESSTVLQNQSQAENSNTSAPKNPGIQSTSAVMPEQNLLASSQKTEAPTPTASSDEPKAARKVAQSNALKSNDAPATIPSATMEIDLEEPVITKSGVENVPTGKVTNTFKSDNIKPEVVYKKHNKDKFFYQYFSNKLTLYGNFDEIVYELLELNTNDGKKLYIYFNDKFFQINTAQTELTPLKEIADSSLVRELNYLRKKKVD